MSSGIIEALSLILAIFLCFNSVLWTLGTLDRKRILKVLDLVVSLLEQVPNGNDKNYDKGGENL